MAENGFDFWQDHSMAYLEMALKTDRNEIIENPDGYGEKTGECGDTITFYLSIEQNHIQSVSYQTDGCLNTNACANTVAQLSEGKSLNEAWEITPDEVVEFLETLPVHEVHCAELAVGAFYLALSDCIRKS